MIWWKRQLEDLEDFTYLGWQYDVNHADADYKEHRWSARLRDQGGLKVYTAQVAPVRASPPLTAALEALLCYDPRTDAASRTPTGPQCPPEEVLLEEIGGPTGYPFPQIELERLEKAGRRIVMRRRAWPRCKKHDHDLLVCVRHFYDGRQQVVVFCPGPSV